MMRGHIKFRKEEVGVREIDFFKTAQTCTFWKVSDLALG